VCDGLKEKREGRNGEELRAWRRRKEEERKWGGVVHEAEWEGEGERKEKKGRGERLGPKGKKGEKKEKRKDKVTRGKLWVGWKRWWNLPQPIKLWHIAKENYYYFQNP
jgi:hypothetical protein